MKTTHAALALSLVTALAAPALAQSDFDDVEIQTTKVADGVAMLVGRGGNLGVSAGPDGVVLIDDQFAPLTGKIVAAVEALGAGPVRYVVNTHWHADHTGGNKNLGQAGAIIVAHDGVFRRMSTDQFMAAFDRTVPAAPAVARPVVTFSESLTFHLNGDTIRIQHVPPAHTDGDAFVHFTAANVIHTGDLYFAGRYPFIDVGSGGSVDGVIAAAEHILSLADDGTRIIPGHGPLSNAAELREYAAMLRGVRDRVRAAIESGADVDTIVANKPTEPWDAAWADGFVKPEQFVRIVYTSLTAER